MQLRAGNNGPEVGFIIKLLGVAIGPVGPATSVSVDVPAPAGVSLTDLLTGGPTAALTAGLVFTGASLKLVGPVVTVALSIANVTAAPIGPVMADFRFLRLDALQLSQ